MRTGKRRDAFIIEKWIDGHHFHVSTRCHTERAALEHLAAFEAAPWKYDPRTRPRDDSGPLMMTPKLIDEHEEWQLTKKRNTPAHVHDVGKYLEAWMLALFDTDLRTVSVGDLKDALASWPTATRHRAIAIKGFYRWLRQERGLLRHAEDATLDLSIPAARAAKLKRRKAVDLQVVQAALSRLDGPALDVMRLLAASGMHYTELRRFVAADGELFPPTPEQKSKGVLAYLAMKHKSGHLHVVALTDPEALQAAERLKKAASVPARSWLVQALHAACDAAKVPRFTPGVMRHSVATWLAMDGVPLQSISELLGHRSPITTERFYRDMGHTAQVVPVPRLRLVKG